MENVVGVFGSAQGKISKDSIAKARLLGHAIADNNCVLVTGACPGLPSEVAKAAREKSGSVIGISPANNRKEHVEKYGYPVENFDFIAFTGFGYKGRNVVTVRSCDIAVFIAGGIGTLNEFTIAYDEGKRIGVLTGTGGISDMIKDVVKKFAENKKAGASVFYDSDPESLVHKLTDGVNAKKWPI